MHMMLTALLLAFALDVEYPKKTDDYVNDFAKVLSPDQVAVIKKTAGDVRTSKKIPIVVCTVPSLEDYGAHDWTIQRYAAALYSDWGIGDKEQNLGVLLFVSIEDRKLRIALGDGLSASFSEPSREVIERIIVPRFKQGDFGGGIVDGVKGIAERLTRGGGSGAHAGTPPPSRTQTPPPAFRRSSGPPAHVGEEAEWRVPGVRLPGIVSSLGGGFCGLLILFIVISVIVSAVRSAIRGGGRVIGGGYGGGYGGGGGYYGGGGGGSGWGGLLLGGLIGNMLGNMMSNRGGGGMSMGGGGGWSSGSSGGGGDSGWSSSDSGSSSSSSSSDWGGGSSSSGGGFSSGGGASGEW